ncbi:MAG: DUF4399 domain-containing protein [Alphaproteobacteria bacterium]|nr:DUF4399 domain-containing protein [Alphaproteobacteria bacterium]
MGTEYRRASGPLGAAAAVGLLVAAAFAAAPVAAAERTPSAPGAKVYIIAPADGATVSSPVLVQFGLSGMGVAPAGIEEAGNSGHHHLLVNKPASDVPMDESLPADDNHRHFGGGQTEASLDLPPGEHRLQLLLADWMHVPHDPPLMSEVVTITVE